MRLQKPCLKLQLTISSTHLCLGVGVWPNVIWRLLQPAQPRQAVAADSCTDTCGEASKLHSRVGSEGATFKHAVSHLATAWRCHIAKWQLRLTFCFYSVLKVIIKFSGLTVPALPCLFNNISLRCPQFPHALLKSQHPLHALRCAHRLTA